MPTSKMWLSAVSFEVLSSAAIAAHNTEGIAKLNVVDGTPVVG